MITVSRRVHSLDALAAQTEPLMRLSASRYSKRMVIVNALHFARAAQNGLRQRDDQVGVNVLLVAAEDLTRGHLERDIHLLFAHIHAHGLAVLDARRHRHAHSLRLMHQALATARNALLCDDLAAAEARATRRSHKERARLHALHTGAVALFTLGGSVSRCAFGAFAWCASVEDAQVELFVHSSTSFFESQIQDFLKCDTKN